LRFRFACLMLAILAAAASPATATVLTFDVFGIFNGASIPQAYGDRVNSLTDAVGSYDLGNGFTPNVEVEYGFFSGSMEALTGQLVWTTGYDSLTNVIYGNNIPIGGPGYYFIRFIADPGWLVQLNSFDIANFQSRAVETKVDVVSNLGGSFTDTFGVAGASVTETYSPMIFGNVVTLQIQGSYFNAGLDNINFDQLADTDGPPIPEPSTALLLLGGLAVLAWQRKRSA
jgi:hypothetical protein